LSARNSYFEELLQLILGLCVAEEKGEEEKEKAEKGDWEY